jgi:hypothetical protein
MACDSGAFLESLQPSMKPKIGFLSTIRTRHRSNMAIHTIKSWSEFFVPIIEGRKLHDLRDTRDRNYCVGDSLILQEYDKNIGEFTGREAIASISFITSNKTPCAFSSSALDRDYAILSLADAELVDPA